MSPLIHSRPLSADSNTSVGGKRWAISTTARHVFHRRKYVALTGNTLPSLRKLRPLGRTAALLISTTVKHHYTQHLSTPRHPRFPNRLRTPVLPTDYAGKNFMRKGRDNRGSERVKLRRDGIHQEPLPFCFVVRSKVGIPHKSEQMAYFHEGGEARRGPNPTGLHGEKYIGIVFRSELSGGENWRAGLFATVTRSIRLDTWGRKRN